MTTRVFTAVALGVEGKVIEVECDTSNGLPSLVIVGLGNKSIDEAKERVRSAIKNTKLDFPKKRITINLAPANLPKDGSHFDLPIAISLLGVSGQVPVKKLIYSLIVGELSLDGKIRPIRGIINFAETAKLGGFKKLFVPADNYNQAILVQGLEIIPLRSLKDIVDYLASGITPEKPLVTESGITEKIRILNQIHGQEVAKRALVISAAGQHNLLLNGPPGAGKSMLAKALVELLPPPTNNEIVEITKINSLSEHNYDKVITNRPFRSPHHSASHISLVGGGRHPKPGEISLASKGVLCLDELPEYARQSLEALRQPLEDRKINISRASEHVTFPADFILIATQNPCPCGYLGDQKHSCDCTVSQIQAYKKKVSGPLLDRIDMVLEVSRIEPDKLLSDSTKSNSDNLKRVVANARLAQFRRYGPEKTNAQLTSDEVKKFTNLSKDSITLINQAANSLNISARAYFKIIKVARTIADIENSDQILPNHISEALQFRSRSNSS